ncbi:major facilitator superfamily domain-containing protein [Lipomyces oligophaga]|uniref:major facilitator superfamily domain-containing protein n=1 Tax=Lipomyces oligophaga TaxID=45792 RepID=UPI0034CEC3FC
MTASTPCSIKLNKKMAEEDDDDEATVDQVTSNFEGGQTALERAKSNSTRAASFVDQQEQTDNTASTGDEKKRTLVDWNGPDDEENPMNFGYFRKWAITMICSVGALCVACSSSIYTATYTGMMKEFGANQEEVITGLTVFVFGMGAGPMFYAPLSEFYGRRIIYIISFFFYIVFQFPIAFSKNITAVLVNRLLAGLSGSAFMSVAGGTVSDLFQKSQLGKPMMAFTAAPFLGPSIGPLMGDFIVHGCGWRWVFYIMIIWSFVMTLLIVFCVPETYAPVLLRRKAQRIRKQTGDFSNIAPIELIDRSVLATVLFSVRRPFELLFLEPMVFCLCLFTSIILGIMYLFFQAFTLVFENNHGFKPQHVGLSFMGLLTGIILGVLTEPFWKRNYDRLSQTRGNGVGKPEYRLPQAMAGGVFTPIGMFWFAFTTYKGIHYIVPIIGSVPFGFGIILVFSGVFTYLVEAYRPYSASALAANGFLRSSFAAGFPLFSVQMYNKLGYAWASALLAFLILMCSPFPFVFFVYGEKLRKRSKFAWTIPDDEQTLSQNPQEDHSTPCDNNIHETDIRMDESAKAENKTETV